eukprot:15676579-Heterocapsa_arctica.AAC.1
MTRPRTKEELGLVSRPISRLGARPDWNGPFMRPTTFCYYKTPDSLGSRSGERRAPRPEKALTQSLPRRWARPAEPKPRGGGSHGQAPQESQADLSPRRKPAV